MNNLGNGQGFYEKGSPQMSGGRELQLLTRGFSVTLETRIQLSHQGLSESIDDCGLCPRGLCLYLHVNF